MSEKQIQNGLDIYIVGVGGQGVLTIADFICQGALAADIPVNFFPTKGMAQRGGFVKAQLRLGKAGFGPSIPEGSADIAIAMESSEALKALRFLKPEGEFVLYGGIWQPTAVMLKKAPYPEQRQIKDMITSAGAKLVFGCHDDVPVYKGLPVRENIFALGLTMGNSALNQMISIDAMKNLVAEKWPKAAEANVMAYEAGVKTAQKAN